MDLVFHAAIDSRIPSVFIFCSILSVCELLISSDRRIHRHAARGPVSRIFHRCAIKESSLFPPSRLQPLCLIRDWPNFIIRSILPATLLYEVL